MEHFFKKSDFVRNFVFGIEDSLVSTVGLISGIATAGVARETILATGVILILVEGFSMAVGSLVSNNSATEVAERREVGYRASVAGAGTMFFSYVGAGILVIIPYMISSTASALPLSITISLIVLFALGALSAKLAGINPIRKGVRMAIIGGLAVGIGSAVGFLFR